MKKHGGAWGVRSMTTSSRNVLAGAAGSAHPVPQSGKQAPGYYRYKVGDIEITVVNDGVSRMLITDDFVTNVSKADVNAALEAAFLEKDFYAGPYNPIVINTGSRLVLVDTGTGEAAFQTSNGLNGRLLLSLEAAGFDPAAFDAVIISHFHPDHINGLLRADGTPAFANAEVLVPAVEHNFWTDEGEKSRATKPRVVASFQNIARVFGGELKSRIRSYEWDKEVIPGVTALNTAGHTPGHSSLVVSSGAKSVYVQADVTHAPFLFARHPDWHIMLDIDPVAAEATRRRVYDMLVAERMLVQGFHYPFPAVGHVEKWGAGYREVLVNWSATV